METKNPAPLMGSGNRADFGMRPSAEFGSSHPQIQESRPRLQLIEWRPMPRNSLRGFATVELPSGLTISDISVHLSHGKSWASLPSRPQLSADGTARRGDDGKIMYSSVLKWRDRDLADRFSAAIVQAVEAEHGALS